MMKILLKPRVLLAVAGVLAAHAACAAELTCVFYAAQRGVIDDYVVPSPVDEAIGNDAIDKLAQQDIFASPAPSAAQAAVTLAREGNDTWTVRPVGGRQPAATYAFVRGPSSVAPAWLADYHRALTKVLHESLRRGVKFDIVTKGNCN